MVVFRNWLNITRYNSYLFGMKFISCLFILVISTILLHSKYMYVCNCDFSVGVWKRIPIIMNLPGRNQQYLYWVQWLKEDGVMSQQEFQHVLHSLCNYFSILDRHHVWRSHDPTSIRLFTYVKKKDVTPPFYLKKMQLFVIRFFLCFVSFCV